MTKYYVINEQYLCYYYDDIPYKAFPLRANIRNGGNPMIAADGSSIPFNVKADHFRDATKADFEEYRICSKGHLPD